MGQWCINGQSFVLFCFVLGFRTSFTQGTFVCTTHSVRDIDGRMTWAHEYMTCKVNTAGKIHGIVPARSMKERSGRVGAEVVYRYGYHGCFGHSKKMEG